MLEFNILKGQYLNRLDKNVVSADTTDLKAQFDLTSDFTGTITVWWRRSDVNNTYTSTLAADGTCTIPAEALAATDKAVYGPYDHDVFVSISDTGRTTTNEYKLTVQRSAFSTNATPGTGGSPTAYEELVEQFDELKAENQTFKDNMTEQQETFESTVTENVDNIRYVVETETAPPIIEEASGAEITLDDSAYRQVRDLQLYGYSKQTQTTGAQLIRYPYRQNGFTNNGITYTVSDDGVITANGTATETSFFFMASEASGWRPSGEVFLSGCPSGGSLTTYRIQLYNYNAEEAFAIDNGEGTAINFTNADSSWNLCIRIASGYTANNLVFKPMLNSGTSALPWEPYSGGVASPSPDWAQPITSVGDSGSVTVESQGANLIDLYAPVSSAGMTDNDDTYSLNRGAANSAFVAYSIEEYKYILRKYSSLQARVRISSSVSGQAVRNDVYPDAYSADEHIDPGASMSEKTSTISIKGDILEAPYANYKIFTTEDGTVTVAKDIMVNAGDTPLPYVPYAAPSSALIALTDSLRGIPVGSGGTYTDESGQQWIADYIYRRVTDGKWMLWRSVKKGELLSSFSWAVSQNGYRLYYMDPDLPSATNTKIISNYFESGIWTNNDSMTICLGNSVSPTIGVSTLDFPSVNALKMWLDAKKSEGNPCYFIAPLATPTVEELPENVQTELNGLYTYNLHTDMWNNDGAYMDLKYVADTKTWINNKIAGLSTAMIENL